MNTSAEQFIESIASNIGDYNKNLLDIKEALEDGEALMHLGVTEEDQEIVEEAHFLVSSWVKSGRKSY